MGLMHPSRKQYDSFTPRTGTYVKPEKRRTVIVNTSTVGDHTIVTLPAGFKATVLLISFYTNTAAAAAIWQLKFDNVALLNYYINASSDVSDLFRFDYNDAPTFTSTITFDVTTAIALQQQNISIMYVLEQAGEGYFTN